MRRRAPILVALGIVAVPWLLWELTRIHEPQYQGKSLTAWIQQYNRFGPAATSRPVDPAKWTEASHALDVIGTNAIPFAMHLASNHDSPLKRLLLKIPMPLRLLDKLGCKDAYMHWTVASTECPQLADRIYMLVGRKAEIPLPAVRRLLRGSNPNTRIVAAHMLWYHVQWQTEEKSQLALPSLAEALKDRSPPVRETAYVSLRGISKGNAPPLKSPEHHAAYRTESARLLLPVLVRLLQDPKGDRVLVLRAIGDLEHFGSSATSSVSLLKDDADLKVCLAARSALARIAINN